MLQMSAEELLNYLDFSSMEAGDQVQGYLEELINIRYEIDELQGQECEECSKKEDVILGLEEEIESMGEDIDKLNEKIEELESDE